MKKILTTAAVAAMLTASTAMADYANGLYGKLHGGATFLMEEKARLSNANQDLKYKQSNSGFVGVGAGYYLHDMFMADVMFDYYFNPELKQKDLTVGGTTYKGKMKADLYTLMVNGYVTPVELEGFKPYLSVGLGVSFIKGKLETNDNNVDSSKSKQEQKFAWSVGAGLSYEVSHGVHGELFYKYSDFGEVKPAVLDRNKDGVIDNNKFHLRGHNVGLGVRVDM